MSASITLTEAAEMLMNQFIPAAIAAIPVAGMIPHPLATIVMISKLPAVVILLTGIPGVADIMNMTTPTAKAAVAHPLPVCVSGDDCRRAVRFLARRDTAGSLPYARLRFRACGRY